MLALLLCGSMLAHAQNVQQVIKLTDANKLISKSTVPPEFNLAEKVPLPDFWQHEREGFYGSVWYEIDFTLGEKAKEQWALLLPEVNMNAQVWINDTYIGSGGSMQAPLSRYWNAPMIYVFSPSDLGLKNKLKIHVVAYANEYGKLGQVSLGPRNTIEPVYNKIYFSTVTIHVISGALSAFYALFMALVWWRRKDPVYFWGALVCSAWSISSMNLYVVNAAMSDLMWERLMQISMGWVPLLFFFYILRLDCIAYKKHFEKPLLLVAASINATIMLAPMELVFLVSRTWHLFSMFFGIVGVMLVFYSWIKNRRRSQFLLLMVFAVIAVCGTHDIMVQHHLLDGYRVFWLDYSVPAILLLVGYMMVSNFLQAVKTAENLNQELESRVINAQNKIEADYEKILLLETEQASTQERERIYRDMHDDMGAKLLSIVYKADSDEMHSLARSAMDDLRAIVSKKPGDKHKLIEVMGRWQQICRKRCEEIGCAFFWQQDEVPDNISLNAESYQNLLRILSEAMTNILKHNQVTIVRIRVRFRFNCLRVVIDDNGDYSQISNWQEGRGISSMRYRIKQLAGKLHWQEKPGIGGRISWILPLDIKQGDGR